MPEVDPNVAYCLDRIGTASAGWDTLIVQGQAATAQSAAELWSVWANVEGWPVWSPLHLSVARKERGELGIAFQGAVNGLIRQAASDVVGQPGWQAEG